MNFDPTISLGSIIQTVIIVATMFGAYNGVTNRMASVEVKVEAMWRHFVEHVKIRDIKIKDINE